MGKEMEKRMILLESQKGVRKRMIADIFFDAHGPLVTVKGWEYRTFKSDVITGFPIFKRPQQKTKGK